MAGLSSLALCVALSGVGQAGAGETVLLEFTADWCGPCQMVKPTVERLIAAGRPVRQVNIDRDRALAARHRVDSIPCFVMLVRGQEVDRLVGPASTDRLEQMLARANTVPVSGGRPQALGQSPDDAAPRANLTNPFDTRAANPPGLERPAHDAPGRLAPPNLDRAPPAFGSPLTERDANPAAPAAELRQPGAPLPLEAMLQSTIRIRVEDQNGVSCGTGTIIDIRGDEALGVTCAHLFREAKGDAPVIIELVGYNPPRKVEGRVVSFDLDKDVGLVTFRPGMRVVAAPVAPKQYKPIVGQRVVSYGCNHGQAPTPVHSRVTSVGRYSGPANLCASGAPVEGRSGGGLFDETGMLVGVCFAADPKDNEGVYAGLASIHSELDRSGLTDVYVRSAAPEAEPNRLADAAPPNFPAEMPGGDSVRTVNPRSLGSNVILANSPAPRTTAAVAPAGGGLANLSGEELAALREIQERTVDAEVVCIVRPLANSQAKSEIIVLDRASPEFIEQLTRLQRRSPPAVRSDAGAGAPAGRRLTSLEAPITRAQSPR